MGGLWHWFTNIIFQWREFDPPIFHNFLGRSSLAAFQVPDSGDSKVVAGESSTGDQMLGNYKKLTIRSISYGISCPIDTLLYSQIPWRSMQQPSAHSCRARCEAAKGFEPHIFAWKPAEKRLQINSEITRYKVQEFLRASKCPILAGKTWVCIRVSQKSKTLFSIDFPVMVDFLLGKQTKS